MDFNIFKRKTKLFMYSGQEWNLSEVVKLYSGSGDNCDGKDELHKY